MSALPNQIPSHGSNGLSQAIASFAPGLPNPTKMFAAEMERAVERQGGEVALDARIGSAVSARRANRQAGFERGRTGSANAAASDREDVTLDDGSDAEIAIVDRADTVSREPLEARRDSSGEQRTREERTPRTTDAKASAPAERGQQAAPEQPAVLGNTAVGTVVAPDANAATASTARAASAVRPVDAVAAFLQGARGDNAERGAQKANAPVPMRPDAELVEHAAQVLKQIRLSLKNGGKEVTVQLSPAELGRIQIRMRSRGGAVSALVRVESRETLELLERQTPELRAALSQSGLEPDSIEFELAFGGAFPDSRAGNGANQTQSEAADSPANADPNSELSETTTRARLSESGVDLYV